MPLRKPLFFWALSLCLALGACNFPWPPLRSEAQTATSAAVTLRARATGAAQAPQSTPESDQASTRPPTVITPLATPTPTPSPTPTATPTSTPEPCNRAAFVRDVSYPDGTEVEINAAITKTWRLRNTGTCTWTSAYELVFERGDQLGAPGSKPLSAAPVRPGDTVDVSVGLTAPDVPGDYQGFFMLRSNTGMVFGVGVNGRNSFWVQLEVVDIPRVDLQIESLSLDPATPTRGEEVSVTVVVRNAGEGPADEFSVGWWPGEEYDDAGCTWTVPSLAASADTSLTCAYSGYPSAYASLTTVARADVGGAIAETEESNNSASLEIQVLEP